MDFEMFSCIRANIIGLFHYYLKYERVDKPEIIERQLQAVDNAFDAFLRGDAIDTISFTLSYRVASEMKYIQCVIDGDLIEVSEGGSVYSPSVGSDSYTLWTYVLHSSGEDEGLFALDFDKILEMINLGAEISFELPDELQEENIAREISENNELAFYESLSSSYERLMERLAKPIVKRLVKKTREKLQSWDKKSNMVLSEEDSGLKNIWEELCVQVQGEMSFFYEDYTDTIEVIVREFLKECAEDDLIIMWTQTEGYENFIYYEGECDQGDVLKGMYDIDDICQYVVNCVIKEADEFHSNRVEKYLFP